MKSRKLISFLAAAAIMASLIVAPLGTSAETTDNLLLGIIPTASTTDRWLLDNRPLKNITNGSGTTFTDENAPWKDPCSLSNVSGKSYSWCRFDFSAATMLNKIIVQEKTGMEQSKDIAIDVLMSSGGWKRVGLKYNIADTYHAISFTFSPVSVLALRLTFGSARTGNGGTDIAEIEGYYDDTITKYDELQTPDNPDYEIEDTFVQMNLLRGLTATSSNTDSWFETNRPISNLTDGTGTSFSKGWSAEYDPICTVTNENGAEVSNAWVQFILPEAKDMNTVIVQMNCQNYRVSDLAIDILLSTGGWKRVAAVYDVKEYNSSGIKFTFEKENVLGARVSTYGKGFNAAEIEAYYDESISSYTGIGAPQDSTHEIPELLSKMNAFRKVSARTSNLNGDLPSSYDKEWFVNTFPTTALSDGSGTSYWKGNDAAYGNPFTKLLNQTGTTYAWAEFKLPEAKIINTVDIQYRMLDVPGVYANDYAVDVKLADGAWKRVAAAYNLSNNWPYTVRLTFEPEKADLVRITFNNARNGSQYIDIAEIEGNYDSTVTEYTGIGLNAAYEIPEIAIGDINADYSFDGSDLAVMRKMLLGAETEYSFTDQNSDGKRDICDLIAMKKRLSSIS